MVIKRFAMALAVCCAAHAGTAAAQQTPAEATGGFGAGPSQEIGNVNIGPLFSPPFGEDHLLGDWGGARPYLAARGINLLADYLTRISATSPAAGAAASTTSGRSGLRWIWTSASSPG